MDVAAERHRAVPRARSRALAQDRPQPGRVPQADLRSSSSSGGRPRWRWTRGSTTPSAGWPSTSRTTTRGARSTPSRLRSRPVAYFSAEFGLHESLPIYSGGLGVLAGDHLKSASDLGIPLIGIGLLYDQGYFRQTLERRRLAGGTLPQRQPRPAADRAGLRPRRQAAPDRDRDQHRRPSGPGLAGRGRPDHAAAARLQRRPRTPRATAL